MAIQHLQTSFVFFAIIVNVALTNHVNKHSTLELVHIIFRHGDRTVGDGYPNDPYANETYYPYGRGELTNAGKTTSYKLGQIIRKTYGRFLGDVYTPSVLKAFSSPFSRCRASQLFVLAGLYPPKTLIQRWNDDLYWQPIPVDYNPTNTDKIFVPNSSCPNMAALSVAYENYMMQNGEFSGYEDVLQYLKEKSGSKQLISQIAPYLQYTLEPQETLGLTLPNWTNSVWPEPIATLAALGVKARIGSEALKTVYGGYLMSQLIGNTFLKINNTSTMNVRKIELYSGHDTTVAVILSWLGAYDEPHWIPYGAYIVFEIHNFKGIHSIKVYYQNYSTATPKPISIRHCGIVCPIDRFVTLYSSYFNGDAFCH